MTTQVWYDREGPLVNKYTLTPAGRLTVQKIDTSARQTLGINAELQKNPDTLRKLKWGTQALQIPPGHLHILKQKYPELTCWDKDIRTKAWKKFMASSESKPYRVKERI